MARRTNDVELVISARNDASKAVNDVKTALKDLQKVQSDLTKSAKDSSSGLGQLTSTFKELQTRAKALDSLGRVAANLGTASTAVDRIGKSVRTAAVELAALAKQQEQQARLSATIKGSLEAERRAQAALKSERAEARQEVTRTTKDLAALTREQERLNASIQKKGSIGVEDKGLLRKNDFLTASIDRASFDQSKAVQQFNGLDAALKKSTASVKDLEVQAKASSQAENDLTRATDRASASLRRQKTDLTESRAVLSEIQTSAAGASVAMGGLAVNEAKVAAESAKVANQLAETKARLDALSSGGRTSGSQTQTSSQVFGDPKLILGQAAAVREAKVRFAEAVAEVQKLARQLKASTGPQEELAAALGRARAAASQASTEYERQRQALATLRQVGQAYTRQAQQQAAASQQAANAAASQNRAQQDVGRFASILARVNAASGAGASSMNEYGRKINEAARSTQGFGEHTRTALDLTQRLRGQILSLTASYIGFQAALNGIGQVVEAFQTLEASSSRLGAVFNQDTTKVGRELAYVNALATRLGISFGVLSDTYSKFSVAASTANFTTEDTRRIFQSVAEAARVNKISIDDMKGVFLALEQMISKGKVTAEELRRQLGNRLPGAFSIFASAIGVSTAQLDAMMKQGQVLADRSTLLKFADELNKRFGPQLESSLKTTTTALGEFGNNVFNARLQVGQGGFIKEFTLLINDLNERLKSREGRDFFLSIGAALGTAVSGIRFLLTNLEYVVVGIKALVALKLGSVLATWAAQSQVLALTFTGITSVHRAFVAQFVAGNATATASTRLLAIGATGVVAPLVALRAVAISVGAALTAMGGPIGIVLRLLTALATYFAVDYFLGFAGDVDKSTEALDEHARIMGIVAKAHQDAKGDIEQTRKSLKDLSQIEADANLVRITDLYAKSLEDLRGVVGQSLPIFDKVPRALRRVGEAFIAGEKGGKKYVSALKDLKKALDGTQKTVADNKKYQDLVQSYIDLAEKTDDAAVTAASFTEALNAIYPALRTDEQKKYGQEVAAAAEKTKTMERNLVDAAAAAKLKGNADQAVATTAGRLGESLTEVTSGLNKNTSALKDASGAAESYKEALEAIAEFVPELKAQLDFDEDLKKINAAYNTLVDQAYANPDDRQQAAGLRRANSMRGQAIDNRTVQREEDRLKGASLSQQEINKEYVKQAAILADKLGVATRDVLAIVGYESSFNPRARGVATGKRAGETYEGSFQFGPGARAKYNIDPLTASIEEQFNAAYEYFKDIGIRSGDEITQLYTAIQTGTRTKSHLSDTANGGAPGNVLDKIASKRFQDNYAKADALLKTYGSSVEKVERASERQEKRQQAYNAELQASIDLAKFEVSIKDKSLAEQEALTAVYEAQAEAKKEGYEVDEATLKNIHDQTKARFEILNPTAEAELREKKARKTAEELNGLIAKRAEIYKQIEIASKNGDTGVVDELKAKLPDLNEQIEVTRQRTLAMYQAVGTDEARGEIEKLNTLTATLNSNAEARRVDQIAIERQEEALALLNAERQRLLAELATANSTNQTGLIPGIEAQIAGLTPKITQARTELQAMYEALGGPDAQAKVSELKTASAELTTLTEKQRVANAANDLAQDTLNAKLAQQAELQAALDRAKSIGGDGTQVEALKGQLQGVNAELLTLIDRAIAATQALGGPGMDAAVQKLQNLKVEVKDASSNVSFLGLDLEQLRDLGSSFSDGLSNAFVDFAEAIAEGENGIDAMKDAFRSFAADFLLQIAKMILQQAILNALKAAFGGGGGILGSIFGGLSHGGSVVGQGSQRREVSPLAFTAARRFHSGGLPGLRSDEVPTILQKGEEVLAKDSPRNIMNRGRDALMGGGGGGDVQVVNTFDPESFLSRGLSGRAGQKVFMNFVSDNSGKIRSALGIR